MGSLVAFGDSYLDSGAALTVSRGAVEAHVPDAKLLPAPPGSPLYADGRWSDGPSMVEHVAHALNRPLHNFAIGGARAAGGNYHAWLSYFVDTGLAAQVESYALTLRGSRVPADTVFVIAAGANDFFQYEDFHQPGYISLDGGLRLSPAVIAARAAYCVAAALRRLTTLGGERFVVSGAYALEQVPFIAEAGVSVERANSFVRAFDAALADELAHVTGAPVVEVFPAADEMRRLAVDGAAHGLANTTSPCQPMLPSPGPRRGPPDRYFWWDEYHPTAAVHRLLGDSLLNLVIRAGWG